MDFTYMRMAALTGSNTAEVPYIQADHGGLRLQICRIGQFHLLVNTDGCKAAGSHFNPFDNNHGGPDDSTRHVGDLGNIVTPEGAPTTRIDMTDDIISLFDVAPENILGRTLVIHQGEDDMGDGGEVDSVTTGNAGGRVACGIVEEVQSRYLVQSEEGVIKFTSLFRN